MEVEDRVLFKFRGFRRDDINDDTIINTILKIHLIGDTFLSMSFPTESDSKVSINFSRRYDSSHAFVT